MNYKLWGTAAAALLLGGVLLALSFEIKESCLSTTSCDSYLNITAIAAGLSVGWIFGIVLSPYSSAEQNRFTAYAKGFGIFASGYLVSKVDKVLEALLTPDFAFNAVHGFRILAFSTSVILALIVTFVFRRYA